MKHPWKGILRKTLKITGIVFGVIAALFILLIVGIYLFHRISLQREAKLISHKGQYVEVDGHKLNLLIEGDGEQTLVFLSGYGTPSPILDFQPLTDRLKGHYRIVVIEKFGYGYSDEIPGDRPLDEMARQDREALKQADIEGPYVICAHSASGLEAIYWALNYPTEVNAIIGLDMAVPKQYDYMGVDLSNARPQDWEDFRSENDLTCLWLYKAGLMRLMNAKDIFPALGSQYLTKEEIEEYLAIAYAKYGQGLDSTILREQWMTERMLGALRGLCDGPLPDVPTLFFVSSDPMMEMQYGSIENWKKMHQEYLTEVSRGDMILVDGGHYFYTEMPKETAEEICKFLEGEK
ncbi:MAG: alpha/beta hydrolase [Lachnospiraceae bacterium]|nr:alpha/beta hydrolase [Lachnospiraceae bacterium]